MPEGFDPLRILAGLRAHGVEYILIGGVAAAAHGSPVDTDDVDICLPMNGENLERMGFALEDLGAREDGPEGEHRVSFVTVAGRLDVFENPTGYAELDAAATAIDLGNGVTARVAPIDHLVEFKRSAGDLVGAAHLAAIAGAAQEAEEQQIAAAAVPDKPRRAERIWKLLEDVDTFLTDLDRGQIRRHRRSNT
ncbi:MAG TPA: hypothetical protein VK646_06915 [Actinomycetota bacterium]|nr:hypothetical protein [Actinomycetota bacterium]